MDVRALVLKMEQRPELETGIRNRKLDALGHGKLTCFLWMRVLVDVDDCPHLIVEQVVVALEMRIVLRFIAEPDRDLDDGEGHTMLRRDLDMHETVAHLVLKRSEVRRFGHATLTHKEGSASSGRAWAPADRWIGHPGDASSPRYFSSGGSAGGTSSPKKGMAP